MSDATLSEPLATTEDCRYCWMCRHVCPVGHVTHRETFTPHAWALTIASVRRGALAWNAETADVLYSCADCGLCRTHCVTDRPLPDAIAVARAQVVAAGAAPAIVGELDARLRRWGNPYGDPDALPARFRAPVASPASPASSALLSPPTPSSPAGSTRSAGATEVSAPVSSPGPASASVPASSSTTPSAAPRGDVALFVGDSAPFLAPGTLDAALALLAAAGVTPVPIAVGRSTGLLADTLGLADTAQALAHAALEAIAASGCRELLVLGAADRYAFQRVYAERLGLAWPSTIVVREVVDRLADAHAAQRFALARREDGAVYAYHDASHGPRIARDGAAPRALLTAALGGDTARRLFWREQRSHPTGATGGLEFTQPALAATLAQARIADAARAGARRLVVDDPADLHQLRQHAAGVEVVCLYELLAHHLAP